LANRPPGGWIKAGRWLLTTQSNLERRASDWLDARTKIEHCSSYVLKQEVQMLKIFVEEAAALASIALFVGMIAVWAQILPQL
jgi:hypothetical protein